MRPVFRGRRGGRLVLINSNLIFLNFSGPLGHGIVKDRRSLLRARLLQRRRGSMAGGTTAAEIFASRDRLYYERLVGPPPPYLALSAYCDEVAQRAGASIAAYGGRGLIQSLHLCGQPFISKGL